MQGPRFLDGPDAAIDLQFCINLGDVGLHGIGRDIQCPRDLLVRLAGGQCLQHLQFSPGYAKRFEGGAILFKRPPWLLRGQPVADPDAKRCKAERDQDDIDLNRIDFGEILIMQPFQPESGGGQGNGIEDDNPDRRTRHRRATRVVSVGTTSRLMICPESPYSSFLFQQIFLPE